MNSNEAISDSYIVEVVAFGSTSWSIDREFSSRDEAWAYASGLVTDSKLYKVRVKVWPLGSCIPFKGGMF